MGNHCTNRMMVIALLAAGGCAQSTNVPRGSENAPEAAPGDLVGYHPTTDNATPGAGAAQDGSFRLADGRPDYDALRARYGEPNTGVVLNPRLTDVAKTAGFTGVEIEADRLTFPGTAAEWLFKKSPGDVLICGPECGPQGLLRRIEYLTTERGKVVVGTSPGKMSDLVQDGWVHIETPVRMPDLSDPSEGGHHPHVVGSEGTGVGNIYKSWTNPGGGLSGTAFQTSMGLTYSFNFDLTAQNGVVTLLTLSMSSSSSVAVATALATTVNTLVTENIITTGAPKQCDYSGSICIFYTSAYTDVTTTKFTTTTTSTVLTPVPFPPAPFPAYPVSPYTVNGPVTTSGPTTVQTSGNSYNPANPIYGQVVSNNTVMTLTGPDLTTSTGSTVVNYNPALYVAPPITLPTEYPQVGIPGLLFAPTLTISVGSAIAYNGSMDIRSNINLIENASSGVSYTNTSGSFTSIDVSSDTYDWPSAGTALPNSSLIATGASGSSFTGSGLFTLTMNVNFNGIAGPVISRTIQPTISAEFDDSGTGTGSSTAQSCNNSHLFANVSGNVTGTIDVGNINGIYDNAFQAHSINLPIPAAHCPSCNYSSECGGSGEGYTCISGWCQPDGTTCLEGTCNGPGQAACSPTTAGQSVSCVALVGPLNDGGQIAEDCCGGQAQGLTACGAGGSCATHGCSSGYVCNVSSHCCEAGSCPNGTSPNCPSGYGPDPAGNTSCCIPQTCTGAVCGNCTGGQVCDFTSQYDCCASNPNSCQYGKCNSTSDCALDKQQLPFNCENNCCVPTTTCSTGDSCLNHSCPGGGAEFNCPASKSTASPWCCQCNSGSTCLNGNSCGTGSYCDTVGCCYGCNSGDVTDPAGDSCYSNGTAAGHTTSCAVVSPPDAGTNHYCK